MFKRVHLGSHVRWQGSPIMNAFELAMLQEGGARNAGEYAKKLSPKMLRTPPLPSSSGVTPPEKSPLFVVRHIGDESGSTPKNEDKSDQSGWGKDGVSIQSISLLDSKRIEVDTLG